MNMWAYIPSGLGGRFCGRADLMRRRGWQVGAPVYLPHEDYKWQLPCSKPACEAPR
jgi:hypothetical protein